MNEKNDEGLNGDQVKYTAIEVINQVSVRLLTVKKEVEIYEILAEGVRQMLPEAYFVVDKLLLDGKNFQIVAIAGFERIMTAIKLILGKEYSDLRFPFDGLPDEVLQVYETRNIHYFPGGIFDIVNGAISKTACNAIEKLLGVAQVAAVSFSIDKKYFGAMTLLMPSSMLVGNKMDKETELAIETLANMASTKIQELRDKKTIEETQVELLDYQAQFSNLISNSTDVVWWAHLDGTGMKDINKAFPKFYGVSAEDFINDPDLWFDLIHPDDKEIVIRSHQDLFRKGKAEVEYRIQRPDKKIIWVQDRKSLIRDQQGNPVKMGGIASDITERKRMEEELKTKNFALDASPVAVGLADFDGKLFYANKAYVKLWGGYQSDHEVIGRHVSEFATSREQVKEVLQVISEGKVYTGEGETIREDGTKFHSIISATVVRHEGKPLCLMALFTDITHQKQLESKLQELNDQLASENRAKDKFFSILAHDLKSPISSMTGFTDLLLDDYENLTDETRLEFLKILKDANHSANRLLENLLEWGRIQLGKITFRKEAFHLFALINENIELCTAQALNKQIEVTNRVDENCILMTDRNVVQAIVRNLLSNALKFTPNGGEITFSVHHRDGIVDLTIADTGIGMNPKTIAKLFKIGEIISAPGTNDETGTGLGLILCHDLIEKTGGKISVQSEPGKGSKFTISFLGSLNNSQ
ncbi:MAG: PAS domain S-box protein [Mangrovibacterium sp.]